MRNDTSLQKIVSGGQTGADQAGLRAARASSNETGGWAPLGWKTEDGPAPWLSEFGLKECPKNGYPARTESNARDSDGMLWFGSTDSPGYRTTIAACTKHKKPYLIIEAEITKPSDVLRWVNTHRVHVLNIAGNREPKTPGLGSRVERFMARVFASCKTDRVS